MPFQHKDIEVEIKDTDDNDGIGTVVASFAKFDEVDRDQELTRPGAFGSQKVLLGAYGHASFGRMGMPVPPIGRGSIKEQDGEAVFTGEFNLAMAAGKETFESVKFSGRLQQWSYGFMVNKESFETIRGRNIRILEKISVHEVSPVMVGAGNATHTVDIKSVMSDLDLTMEDHSELVLATCSEYFDRMKSLLERREKAGRTISAANRSRLDNLRSRLDEINGEIAKLLEDAEPPDTDAGKDAALGVLAQFQKIRSEYLQGV